MPDAFHAITIFGRPRVSDDDFADTLNSLQQFLQTKQCSVYIEKETAQYLKKNPLPTIDAENLGAKSDLIVVLGGDGSLLNAAHSAIHHDLPIVGINRGRLGFLTDIIPNELETKLSEVLAGKYIEEKRFMIAATLEQEGQITKMGDALNDIVLLPGDVPHMIEFEIHINQQMVNSQRADGLIVSTPTGSTAYALSGGGPIMHPGLDAIALVPMFPHTLSSRPIVIDSDSEISICIDESNETSPQISCDGQQRMSVKPGSKVHIKKKDKLLRLIHPLDYNYYETLRSKLRWETKN